MSPDLRFPEGGHSVFAGGELTRSWMSWRAVSSLPWDLLTRGSESGGDLLKVPYQSLWAESQAEGGGRGRVGGGRKTRGFT